MSAESTVMAAQELVVRHNRQVLLDQATLALAARDRVGLVGRNGCGKSTFLRIIAGQTVPDAGTVTFRRGLILGYLPQDPALDPALTVAENVRAGARHVLDRIQEFESLPGHSPRADELEAEIHRLDGWNLDQRIAETLSHLNSPPPEAPVHTLSGGEQRRVALARAIVGRPDLLILDEPTNHLDADSVDWVGDYLAAYPGALLVVTHDRHFLEKVCTEMVELRNGTFERYTGSYTDYLVQRASKLAAEEAVEHKRQMFLRREIDWVRRGPSAQRTKSKVRMAEFYNIADQEAPPVEEDLELIIPPPPPLGNRGATLENVSLTLGGRQLFAGINLEFVVGTRIGVVGRNGVGKTSLLRVILGELPPTSGTVRIGPLTRFNYVDQGRLQLNPERTVLEEIADGTEYVQWGEQKLSLRGYLKRFLFAEDRIVTLVRHLSGGERSRLLLAKVLKRGGNFLVLDEPTNDLDLATLRVLEEALMAFPGAVLVVSHDRYFLNRVCTGIVAFEGDGRVVQSAGNYDYYIEKRERAAQAAALFNAPPPRPRAATAEPAAPRANRPRRLSFKEQRELEGIEPAILAAETRIAEIEALFTQPDFHRTHGRQVAALNEELQQVRDRVTQLYARWEELEAIRAAAG